MLTKRIIPCLDVKDGQVVKGTKFKELKIIGNPLYFAKKYYDEGADELCLLDISASEESRKTNILLVQKIAESLFIPFTVGGGIKNIEDMELLLKYGADKVSICTQAVLIPQMISEASSRFGSQAIVVSIDVKKTSDSWKVHIYGGKKATDVDALDFALKCEQLGAGEILLNSLDRDGTSLGYDLELLRRISKKVSIPVIASSGAGNLEQMHNAVIKGKADALLAASVFHSDKLKIQDVKDYLKNKGVDVR